MSRGIQSLIDSDLWTFIVCVPEDVTMICASSELYDEQSKESIEAKKSTGKGLFDFRIDRPLNKALERADELLP